MMGTKKILFRLLAVLFYINIVFAKPTCNDAKAEIYSDSIESLLNSFKHGPVAQSDVTVVAPPAPLPVPPTAVPPAPAVPAASFLPPSGFYPDLGFLALTSRAFPPPVAGLSPPPLSPSLSAELAALLAPAPVIPSGLGLPAGALLPGLGLPLPPPSAANPLLPPYALPPNPLGTLPPGLNLPAELAALYSFGAPGAPTILPPKILPAAPLPPPPYIPPCPTAPLPPLPPPPPIPVVPTNPRQNEIFIHKSEPIVVKRPATKVSVNQEPLIVKVPPVIFHRPASVVVRPVIFKPPPPPIIQPIIVPQPHHIHPPCLPVPNPAPIVPAVPAPVAPAPVVPESFTPIIIPSSSSGNVEISPYSPPKVSVTQGDDYFD